LNHAVGVLSGAARECTIGDRLDESEPGETEEMDYTINKRPAQNLTAAVLVCAPAEANV
jgi:hypothetical protein